MTDLIERARAWTDGDPDPETRARLEELAANGDLPALERHMEGVLTFGTAGIRGEVGAGPAMMNRAVVIRTTFGLAGYLGETSRPVILGFDARPTSRAFAEDVAGVLSAAGITVRYFAEVTPTPVVAFAAKHLGAAAAVVITASHNPPADNGYKVYGPDAAQIVSPIDESIQRADRDGSTRQRDPQGGGCVRRRLRSGEHCARGFDRPLLGRAGGDPFPDDRFGSASGVHPDPRCGPGCRPRHDEPGRAHRR